MPPHLLNENALYPWCRGCLIAFVFTPITNKCPDLMEQNSLGLRLYHLLRLYNLKPQLTIMWSM
jgi:hypothetical protein